MSSAEIITVESVRHGIDELKQQLSTGDPEIAERVLQQLCERNALAGETWHQAFIRLLNERDPIAEAITVAHDRAFRLRAAQ